MNKKINADKSKRIFFVSLVMFIAAAAVLVICIIFRSFAEFYCRTVSSAIRFVISHLFGIFPFSVAEAVLILMPVILVICAAVCILKHISVKKALLIILSLVFVLVFLFINVFGVCYLRNSIEENMGFELQEITSDDLKEYALAVRERLEKSSDDVVFKDDYSSDNPHEWKKLNELVDRGYNSLAMQHPFISNINTNAKRIFLSEYMTYTHISGIYIPFTSEANVNTNYPDYVVAYSLAHEKAHQRGIASEDEANFVAFLACMLSGDDYLEYSALLSMYDYFLDAIYKSDPESYYDLLESTDKRIIGEMYAYSVFFDEYRNSAASKVADTVNDTYIKTMGDNRGVESYSRVVELCVSYFKSNS